MTVALRVEGLTKRFGDVEAVRGVTFELQAGTVTGFIGPNGAGKTTTLRMCATLELPDSGEVYVAGRSVLDDPRGARRFLGFMPDGYGTYANTTVHEYVDFFARAHGLRGAERRSAVAAAVEFTGLAPLLSKQTTALSKGMRQRLCLAKTLLHDPQVLLLDEPTAGLDPHARIEFRDLVRDLAKLGKSLLVSSHILPELAEFCDSVVVIERGALLVAGRIEDVQRGGREHFRVGIRALAEPRRVALFLAEQPAIGAIEERADGASFDFAGSERDLAALLAAAVAAGLEPCEFHREEGGLEDLFLELTNKETR